MRKSLGHAALLERDVFEQKCLLIPINGIYYQVKPVDPDTWLILSQASISAGRRDDGTATESDYHKTVMLRGARLYRLTLGDALNDMRKDKPGREWIEAAALVAFHWHLEGLNIALAMWGGVLDGLERSGYVIESR